MQKYTGFFHELERIPRSFPEAPFSFVCGQSGLREIFWDRTDSDHEKFMSFFHQHLIKQDRYFQIRCFSNLKQMGVWNALKAFSKTRPAGAFTPDFVDLWYLYRYIRCNKPEDILELGSGLSTCVMGVALLQNGRGRLHSLEPNEVWAESTNRSLPEDLRGHCLVTPSRIGSCTAGDVVTTCFIDLPTVSPDMIYIDGAPEGATWLGSETVAQIEDTLSPGTAIFIDSRLNALLYFLKGHAKRKYRIDAQAVMLVDAATGKLVDYRFGLDQFENSYLRLLR